MRAVEALDLFGLGFIAGAVVVALVTLYIVSNHVWQLIPPA